MEGLLLLMGLGVLAVLILAPIVAIVAFVRASSVQAELGRLRRDVAALEARLGALIKTVKPARADAGAPAGPAPVEDEPQGAVGPTARHAEGQAAAPVVPVAPVTPVAQAFRAPAPSMVSAPIAPPAPAVAPSERPAPPAQRPVFTPPPPSRPPLAARPAPPPSGPSFDWESLLGLRGAAWLGGIALVIGAALLAKLAFDQNLITPSMRVALLVLMGTAALVVAELSLRRGYATTANAVSGAGIAILYIAFYAGKAFYHLPVFSAALTFGLMVLVTVVACAVAIRYDAAFTAVLGLLGGFATPVLLSTGVDRPVALFSYILVLNLGLLTIALRKRWHGLVLLALGGTFLIELVWYARFMSPEKALIGLIAFLAFGLLYAFLPAVARTPDDTVMTSGAVGGVVPYLFGLLIAGQTTYAAEWPLLFAFVGLLGAALVTVGVLRSRIELLLSASVATALFLPIWAGQNLKESSAVWGPTLAAIAIVAVLNLAYALANRFRPALLDDQGVSLDVGGLLAALGLGLFALVLVVRGLGEPPWPFLTLVSALTAVLLARSRAGRLPGILATGSLALAILIQIWFFNVTDGAVLLRNLSLPLLLAIVLSLVASGRARTGRAARADLDGEAGVVLSVVVALAGLSGCLVTSELGSDPRPLFAALAVATGILVASGLRSGWSVLVLLALGASALFATSWQVAYFHAPDLPTALLVYFAFSLAFLVLPFVVPARQPSSPGSAWGLWFASALSGPFFFYALYRAVTESWGKRAIGALPLVLAAFAVLALSGVSRRFVARVAEPDSARLRLRYLALFAAVALGLVALAIPLQLDRQWITVGWALEAMAVFWLFERLPHPGLRLFGMILFGAVGARLLVNPEVLRYEPNGWPILNWLLYTYGVAALSCFLGARFLRSAEKRSPALAGAQSPWRHLAPAVAFLGLLLVFWLINLEIFDFFSQDRAVIELSFAHHYARDLTMSFAWGLYAIALLIIGIWRRVRALRYVGLGFLVLTVSKVFLYDLATLTGLYRVLSFFGLGLALVLVSLIYQRFVVSREVAR